MERADTYRKVEVLFEPAAGRAHVAAIEGEHAQSGEEERVELLELHLFDRLFGLAKEEFGVIELAHLEVGLTEREVLLGQHELIAQLPKAIEREAMVEQRSRDVAEQGEIDGPGSMEHGDEGRGSVVELVGSVRERTRRVHDLTTSETEPRGDDLKEEGRIVGPIDSASSQQLLREAQTSLPLENLGLSEQGPGADAPGFFGELGEEVSRAVVLLVSNRQLGSQGASQKPKASVPVLQARQQRIHATLSGEIELRLRQAGDLFEGRLLGDPSADHAFGRLRELDVPTKWRNHRTINGHDPTSRRSCTSFVHLCNLNWHAIGPSPLVRATKSLKIWSSPARNCARGVSD